MRHGLLAFLLVLSLGFLPLANAQTTVPTTPESEQLRKAADKLLASGSADDAVKAADLYDKASQIDARNAATLKAQSDSGWMALIVTLTPFFSVLLVALGFVFNTYQARIAEREKEADAARQRQADLDKNYVDAVTLIQKSEDFSPVAALLSRFLTGPYAETARQTGASILIRTKSFENFSDIFNTFVEPVSRKNLKQVIDLMRTVSIAAQPLLAKTWVDGKPKMDTLTPEETEKYNLLVQERIFLGTKVAAVLRQPRESPDPIDLSSVGFDASDLRGADLRNANIASATWNLVNLDGADLRGVTNFQSTWFYNTAWWHVAYIDRGFLKYLNEQVPFTPGQGANTPLAISAEEYGENLTRLTAAAA